MANTKPETLPSGGESSSPARLAASLAALGLTAIASQIVLFREFMAVFYGNELVIGVVLANWMLLTGAGAFIGRLSGRQAGRAAAVTLALIGLALLPVSTVVLLRLLRNIVFLPGVMIGLWHAAISSFVLLAPFCLLSGFSFALFAGGLAQRRGETVVALSYAWESLGSAIGGLVFTLALLPWLDTFQALAIILAVDLGLACLVARAGRRPVLAWLCAALLLAAALVLALSEPDALTRRFLFPGQEVVAFRDTPYGNLTVTRQGEQLNFFENAVLMSSNNEVAASEESVHYAMLQHPRPQRVLLIGGGIAGGTGEILKYGVQAVDYAEVNPWLIGLARVYTPALADARVGVISDDARRHVRRTKARYDVALVNLPDPETAHLNRYFTVEFFKELKAVLRPGGIIASSLLPATEYQGPEAMRLTSSLHATLKSVFANVLIVPGGRNYFLASDSVLDIGIGRLAAARGLATVYVNHYYLDDRMLAERSQGLSAALDKAAPLNTDFAPACYSQQLAYWLSSLGVSAGPWVWLSLAAGLMLAWRFSAVNAAIFASGLCASSLEMILLIAFQALFGALYQMTGLLVAAFMAGLAAGSWGMGRRAAPGRMASFILLQLAVAAVGLSLPLLLIRLQGAELAPAAGPLLFGGLAFAVAALVGMEFAVAARLRGGSASRIAGELYGLDLAGAAVGALVVTVYVIPLFGVTVASMLVGLVSATGAVVCYFSKGEEKG